MMYGFVYQITNLINNKVYIGQTTRSIEQRWVEHSVYSSKSKAPLHRAIRKYGVDNFSVTLLCECSTQEELDDKERLFAFERNSISPYGYNCKDAINHGNMSPESRRRQSEAQMGKPSGMLGKKLSDETRRKMSEAALGHQVSQERRNNIGAANATKEFHFVSPKGENILVTNLQKFCRDQSLQASKMHNVHTGKRNKHKGWTKAFK